MAAQMKIRFDLLIGQRLSSVHFAANILCMHFGDIRPHPRGGTVGAYALHVDCPWRIDGPDRTITGNYDRWDYAGPGEAPEDWEPETGPTLRDKRLDELFGQREVGSWVRDPDRFLVTAAHQTNFGDVTLELSDGYRILLFPAATEAEAWRFFVPGDESPHLVFPVESN
jgi:hypothetical protein